MAHQYKVIAAGKPVAEAEKALIMIHGRGATARDILTLAPHLNVSDYALLAPQATGNTWYPQSFLAPIEENEPWLSSALENLQQLTKEVIAAGIKKENIYFLGFSQGACLTMEFIARNADKYGGAVAFTGGLIGPAVNTANYKGNFEKMPVFIGSSDPDFHVPVTRVHETTKVLEDMGADVTTIVYPQMGHTISQNEINEVNRLIFSK
ncbi:alpha/beta hydrolase [Chitinophaga sp. Cy-1792]|uniref:alpha/beta hydrolase n=1 Tax=Chitinophaga sp. Cy-1792 TaxID=2608339 RepID=UPI001420E751|nr:dienelactone hydrolase family protein [Chitinophaga sp. Cy-1792]NIG54822.1 phospholipase [Chitinophaga sp. Cy-1792]